MLGCNQLQLALCTLRRMLSTTLFENGTFLSKYQILKEISVKVTFYLSRNCGGRVLLIFFKVHDCKVIKMYIFHNVGKVYLCCFRNQF